MTHNCQIKRRIDGKRQITRLVNATTGAVILSVRVYEWGGRWYTHCELDAEQISEPVRLEVEDLKGTVKGLADPGIAGGILV